MKREFLKENAITLIALIITIIILLILAGVAISAVVGDNGILNQAVNAADETNIANVKTELEMAVSAVVSEWNGARYTNENIGTLAEYMTKAKMQANMNKDDYTLKKLVFNVKNGTVVKYKEKDYNFTVEITESGNSATVSYDGCTDSIDYQFGDVGTYGDYVDYPIDVNNDGNTTNDWRIFYSDGSRIFIITADYVQNNSEYLNNELTGMTDVTSRNYVLYWNSIPEAQTVNQSTLNLFKQSWNDYNSYENGRCISTLLNTNNWSGFVNSVFADYAIGGPTIEMWVESYNDNRYDPLYIDAGMYGYNIGISENPETIYQYVTDLDNNGYYNELYWPHRTSEASDGTICYGYWLASPGANDAYRIMRVDCNGGIVTNNEYDEYYGVRPVVSLLSTVTATQNEDEIWELSN